MSRSVNRLRLHAILGGLAILAAAAAWICRSTAAVPPIPRASAAIPSLQVQDGHAVLTAPGRRLMAEVAEYEDEMFAYLITSYLRGTATFRNWDVLLTVREESGRLAYPVIVSYRGPDVPAGLSRLYSAQVRGLVPRVDWQLAPVSVLEGFRRQNNVFEVAYNLPVRRTLERLSRGELIRYASRFVRFKSSSDPRTWRRGLASLQPLASASARQLSEDIVTIAEFYSVPLDSFLGIGAMENNYMDARGDAAHTVWKRRAQSGDLVVKRTAGRVLVSNYSVGVWQITRETLRYAHKLYLRDTRDYGGLPAGLRPPAELKLDSVEPRVLTTYAGLLFRDLLDRCGGDVEAAVGAYNGGLRNPNYLYASGVSAAAGHARTFMEHSAALGTPVARMQFLAAPASQMRY